MAEPSSDIEMGGAAKAKVDADGVRKADAADADDDGKESSPSDVRGSRCAQLLCCPFHTLFAEYRESTSRCERVGRILMYLGIAGTFVGSIGAMVILKDIKMVIWGDGDGTISPWYEVLGIGLLMVSVCGYSGARRKTDLLWIYFLYVSILAPFGLHKAINYQWEKNLGTCPSGSVMIEQEESSTCQIVGGAEAQLCILVISLLCLVVALIVIVHTCRGNRPCYNSEELDLPPMDLIQTRP